MIKTDNRRQPTSISDKDTYYMYIMYVHSDELSVQSILIKTDKPTKYTNMVLFF